MLRLAKFAANNKPLRVYVTNNKIGSETARFSDDKTRFSERTDVEAVGIGIPHADPKTRLSAEKPRFSRVNAAPDGRKEICRPPFYFLRLRFRFFVPITANAMTAITARTATTITTHCRICHSAGLRAQVAGSKRSGILPLD